MTVQSSCNITSFAFKYLEFGKTNIFQFFFIYDILYFQYPDFFLGPSKVCYSSSWLSSLNLNMVFSFFCRFLRLLSEYDWSFSPLIVDINGDLTPDDDKEINVNAAPQNISFIFLFIE